MAVTGEIHQGSTMIADANELIDELDGTDINNATITLNLYDEDASDALVSGPHNVTNPGGDNDYYALIPDTDTAVMTLRHIIRLQYDIDAGVDRKKVVASWARVTIPTDPL